MNDDAYFHAQKIPQNKIPAPWHQLICNTRTRTNGLFVVGLSENPAVCRLRVHAVDMSNGRDCHHFSLAFQYGYNATQTYSS